MEELIQKVIAATGVTHEQAVGAIQTVVGVLKDKLPAPLASQVDTFLTADTIGGALDQAKGWRQPRILTA